MIRPLSFDETARALARSPDWLGRHWRRLVAEQGFPLPLHDDKPLAWDPAHVYAWLDRRLPDALREPVARLRAGPVFYMDAAGNVAAQEHMDIDRWRESLERRHAG